MIAAAKPPAIKACLFDMDGLLIDSEDIYTRVVNEILAENGKGKLPWKIKAQLQGRPGPEAGRIFHEWAQLPMSNEEYMAKQSKLQKEYFPSTQPLLGVLDLLAQLKARGIYLALATSSHAGNFELKSSHLPHLFEYFSPENRVLGDDTRIPKGRGKPAPDIYLLALKTLNDKFAKEGKEEIKPEECLVFEDSVPGAESGRRAGMQVVWCPHPELLVEFKGKEKEVLAGLTGEHKEMESEVKGPDGKVKGAPGEIDDGWGTLLESLVDFPYAKFGMREGKQGAQGAKGDEVPPEVKIAEEIDSTEEQPPIPTVT